MNSRSLSNEYFVLHVKRYIQDTPIIKDSICDYFHNHRGSKAHKAMKGKCSKALQAERRKREQKTA